MSKPLLSRKFLASDATGTGLSFCATQMIPIILLMSADCQARWGQRTMQTWEGAPPDEAGMDVVVEGGEDSGW